MPTPNSENANNEAAKAEAEKAKKLAEAEKAAQVAALDKAKAEHGSRVAEAEAKAKADEEAKKAAEKDAPKADAPVMVDARELVKAMGLNQIAAGASSSFEDEEAASKLNYSPFGGIFKLDEDGEYVNSFGQLVDEEGYLLEPEVRSGRRRR